MLHHMPLRQFIPRQPIPDQQTRPQEQRLDPDVSIKHDNFYARAWDMVYERPFSDTGYDNAATPGSPKIATRSDSAADETCNTPRTPRESSPGSFHSTDGLSDVTDTFFPIEPDAETSSEQLIFTPTNLRSSKYNLCHNLKPNCNDNYR